MRASQPREIIVLPDTRLRQISNKIVSFDESLGMIAKKLVGVLEKVDRSYLPVDALGMAAPQIGFNQRVIAVRNGGFKSYLILVNPEILTQKLLLPIPETCYSVKGVRITWRYLWLKVSYRDLSGNYFQRSFFGTKAIVLQQEVDHLNGKLISDY